MAPGAKHLALALRCMAPLVQVLWHQVLVDGASTLQVQPASASTSYGTIAGAYLHLEVPGILHLGADGPAPKVLLVLVLLHLAGALALWAR